MQLVRFAARRHVLQYYYSLVLMVFVQFVPGENTNLLNVIVNCGVKSFQLETHDKKERAAV